MNENISEKQAISIMILFILGSTIVVGSGSLAGRDSWLATTISFLGAVPLYLMYSKILSSFPGLNIYEINEKLLGKYLGKFTSLLYVWFSLHLGALVIRNFGEFILTVSLPETPILVTMLFMGLLCSWMVKEGVEVLGSFSEYFVIIIVFFIVLINTSITLPKMDFDNVRPLLYDGWKPVISASFIALTFPFAETVLLASFISRIKDSKKIKRIYIMGGLCAYLVVFIVTIVNVLVLGPELVSNYNFPSYYVLSKVNIAEFLQRMEILISSVFIITGIVKISSCLFSFCIGIKTVFNLDDYHFLAVPSGILMIGLAYIVYDSIFEMMDFAFKIWPFYATPFEIIIPFFLYLLCLINKRENNKDKK